MTTAETSEPILTNLVERYARVRAIAGDVAKALEDANTKLDEMWSELIYVADSYHELLGEAREAFRPVVERGGTVGEYDTPESDRGACHGPLHGRRRD
jgi:hypothetical protein